MYYFPNGLKQALFGTYLQVQFHEIAPISHASTKNVFTEDGFDTIIAYLEDQTVSHLDLRCILLLDYIIIDDSNRIHHDFIRFISSIHSYR